MSVFYEIKEHLQVKRNEENVDDITGAGDALQAMQGQLAALAALMLAGDDSIRFKLRLTADGKTYICEGKEVMPEFKTILDVLPNAAEVDLEAAYGYTHHGGWAMYDLVGPFPLMKLLGDYKSDDPYWDGIFYSAWNNADCNEDAGCLVAYGKKDGKVYRGQLSGKIAASLPDGDWNEWMSSSLYALGDPKDAAFVDACEALADYFGEDLQLDEDGEYYLNSFPLHNDAEARRFFELMTEVKQRASEFSLIAALADTSHPDAQLADIEETDDGFVLRVTQV